MSDALLDVLAQHPEGLTPGAAWRATRDHAAGDPERATHDHDRATRDHDRATHDRATHDHATHDHDRATGDPEHAAGDPLGEGTHEDELAFRRHAGGLLRSGAMIRDGALWHFRTRAAPSDKSPDKPKNPVRDAARVFLAEGLSKGGSVFARGSHAWTVEHAERLAAAVAERCRDRPGNFAAGLSALLPVCSDETRVLLAELLALSSLPIGPGDLRPEVKRERVVAVIDRVNRFVLLPAVVEEAFAHGPAPAGTWHSRDLWPAVQYLAEFAALWLSRDTEIRLLTLRHPGAWSTVVLGARGGDAAVQREALLHFGHPESFVALFSGTAKRAAAEALAGETGREQPGEPMDGTLARIAGLLEAERGGVPVSLYESPWRERWEPHVAAAAGADAKQAWFVRDWYPGGGDYLAEWLHHGAVTVPANERSGHWSQMGEGDLVAVATRDVVHLGRVAGPEEPAGDGVVRRAVRWLTESRPIALGRLRGKLSTDLDRQERVIAMRAELELLASLARAFAPSRTGGDAVYLRHDT